MAQSAARDPLPGLLSVDMTRYRIRQDDAVLAEGESVSLDVAVQYMLDTLRSRVSDSRADAVLEALDEGAWLTQLTLHVDSLA